MPIVELPHSACPYNCAWNGVEDQYERACGNRPPQYLFFCLSGLCNFVYLSNKALPAPKTVYWGNGITNSMYEFLSDIAGYSYRKSECGSFASALSKIKRHIDNGVPVTLGALDMFHLPYFGRFYGKVHIPIHYVLAIGYDDAKQCVIVYDCDRAEPQYVGYCDLEKAWSVRTKGFSSPFTCFTHDFNNIQQLDNVIRSGIRKKCLVNLNPPVSFMGIRGIRKLAREILTWRTAMTGDEYRTCLLHFVEYTGFPPVLPKLLAEVPDDKEYRHMGGREIMSGMLRGLSVEYGGDQWEESALWFERSGKEIEALTETITRCLISHAELPPAVSSSLLQIADMEEQAYLCLMAYDCV